MRAFLRKIAVRIGVFIITFSIVCNIAYFALNLLPHRNQIFSSVASRLLQQSVKIKQSDIEGFLYRPVFVFHTVTVGQIQLHELHITLNVWRSILERQWVTLQVVIDHLHLQVHKNADQHYEISGLTDTAISLPQQTPSITALIAWIGTQPEIIFSKTQIDFYHENGTYLPIEPLNVLIKNQDDKHFVSAHFYLKQTVPTSLQLIAKITGNPFQDPQTVATVFVQGQQVHLSQWIAYFPKALRFKKITPLHGIANFKTWVRYANQQVQRVQSQFMLKNISYAQLSMHQLSADAVWMRDQTSWELQAQFNPLGVAQHAMIPGFSGVFGMLRMTPTRGALMIDGKNTQIIFPLKFLQAPLLSNVFAKINWNREKKDWRIEAESIKLDNSKWRLFTQFVSHLDFQQKPQLQLSGITSINGNVFDAMHATIADLTHPVLLAQAKMKTDFSKALDLLGESSIKADGPLLCDVDIKWPLSDKNEKNNGLSLHGAIHFLNDHIEFPKWDVPLTDVTGVAEFNDQRFFANHLQATLFHAPLSISIDAKRHIDQLSHIHITLDGSMNMAELSHRIDFPLLNQIHGNIPFNAQLMMKDFNSTDFSNVAVKLGEFYVFDQLWRNLSLEIIPLQNAASIRLDNADISGDILFPTKKEIPLRARLHYLSLQLKKQNTTAGASTVVDPASIPAMDIAIDNLQINQHSEGRVHWVTEPIQHGLAIRQITMDSPLLKFFAKGSWVLHHLHADTTLMGRMSSSDLGDVLSQHHLSSRLKHGKFSSGFSFTWPGAPYQFSIDHAIGKADMLIKQGRILQLDSDTETNLALGRLLNVFSLETISHLISFDFSALTKKGFSFDVLQGNMELSQGTLFMQNIELDGPLAKVDFQGKISFTDQLNDLSMAVFPKVSSSIPALIGFAGGPVAGAAAWLANKIISPTVGQLMQMNYHIGGTPDKPIVTKIQNK